MTTGQVVAFLLFTVAAAATPGPSNIMLAAAGAHAGVVRGLPCLLGAATGMGAMLFLVPLGLGSVVSGHSSVLGAIHWGGAAVLLWLAWKIATAASRAGAAPDAAPVGYLGAAVFQWANPKAWLVSTSATATFLRAGAGSPLEQAASLGALFVMAALPCFFLWLAFGTSLRRWLSNPRRVRTFNVTMGALLALSVVLLFR